MNSKHAHPFHPQCRWKWNQNRITLSHIPTHCPSPPFYQLVFNMLSPSLTIKLHHRYRGLYFINSLSPHPLFTLSLSLSIYIYVHACIDNISLSVPIQWMRSFFCSHWYTNRGILGAFTCDWPNSQASGRLLCEFDWSAKLVVSVHEPQWVSVVTSDI